MTANHPEDLVARLLGRANTRNGTLVGASDGGTHTLGYYSHRDGELDRDAAATITSLVGERDALRAVTTDPVAMRVNLMRGTFVKPDDLVWLHDTNGPVADIRAQLAAAESTIRNRDETIAAAAAAFDSMTDQWVERRKAFEIIGDDPTVALINEFIGDTARALASPHQEGTGT